MARTFMLGVVLALLVLAISARAHDPDGKWDEWFLLQRNVRGASCCDISHAHYVKDEDWRSDGKHYQVRVGDRWHDVEDWQMVKPKGANPTGNAVLWYNDVQGNFLIFCFTPANET